MSSSYNLKWVEDGSEFKVEEIGSVFRSKIFENRGEPYVKIGPDGMALCILTPVGTWCIDHRASDGGYWTRNSIPTDLKTGDPVPLTVSPSIAITCKGYYHGWIRDGKLIEC